MECPNCKVKLKPVEQNEGVYSCAECKAFFTIEYLTALDRITELEKEVEKYQQEAEYHEAMADSEMERANELGKIVMKLRKALEKIRDEQGKVCEEYEVCNHVACNSSYHSWAYADQALKGKEIAT